MSLYFLVGLFTFVVAFLDSRDKIQKWQTLGAGGKSALVVQLVLYLAIFIFTAVLYWNDLDEKTRLSRVGRFHIDTEGRFVKKPVLAFGDLGGTLTGDSTVTFVTKWNDIFSLRAVNGKYNVILYLREKDGDAVASINGTLFKIYHDGYDFNYDSKGFEIVTGDLKVVFQLDYRDGAVYMAGLLYKEDGSSLYIHGPYIDFPKRDFIEPANEIPRLFKYPREEYFRQRVD